MAKLPNHRLVKIHRIYTVEEAARCLAVHKHTVRRWTKAGLPTVGGRGKTLILGSELRPYLEARRKDAKRACPLLLEVPSAAATGCGHDRIYPHDADVG